MLLKKRYKELEDKEEDVNSYQRTPNKRRRYWNLKMGRAAQSVQQLTTGWMVQDRIPVGTRFSAHPDRPWGPPSLLYNGYRVFPGCKVQPGRASDHSPLLVPRSWKSRAIPLPTLWATPGLLTGNFTFTLHTQIEGRNSSVSIATRYGLDRIPLCVQFSVAVQTGPGAHPASCTMGTGSFPGVKRLKSGIDHPPPSSAEVKQRVQLYLYSPSGPLWPVLG